MNIHFLPVAAISTILIGLGGCASTVNTAGTADFGCPGMPLGVTCKTPAAVYKSTNQDFPVTDFDTPLGTLPLAQSSSLPGSMDTPSQSVQTPKTVSPYVLPAVAAIERKTAKPKPVREPAKVMRIWIAPWVDTQDTLHLAQIHYVEITPRTWTVGKPETKAGAGYVIPHVSFDSIGQNPNLGDAQSPKNSRPEQRDSDSNTMSANAQPVPASSP